MKRNLKKVMIAAAAVLAVVFNCVVAADAKTIYAEEKYDNFYLSDAETLKAGAEKQFSFSIVEKEDVAIRVVAKEPYAAKLTLYNSKGAVVDSYENNPMTVAAGKWTWYDVFKAYTYTIQYDHLRAGDYFFGVESSKKNVCRIFMGRVYYPPVIVTAGYTQTLKVDDAKVVKWSSGKTSVASVDAKGKVTAKKPGKTMITAKLSDGDILTCPVKVATNKYTAVRHSASDTPPGMIRMDVYSAAFDSKGNLVIKARVVNNYNYKLTAFRYINISANDADGKLIGMYSVENEPALVDPSKTKDFRFTIRKADLNQKKADLRNANISLDVGYSYN